MSAAALITAFAIPGVTGFLAVTWALGDDLEEGGFSFSERFFLGLGLGLGLLSCEMFLLGLASVPYGLLSVTVPQVLLMAAFYYLLRARGKGRPLVGLLGNGGALRAEPASSRPLRCILFVLSAWIALKVGFVFFESLVRPINSWDAWAHWAGGAKFFFYERGLALDSGPSGEFFFGKGVRTYIWYPLHLPLTQVWISLWLGDFHEIYAKAWAAVYFSSMLGVIYFAVKRESSRTCALLATFFLSSAPLITYHATGGYSDLPLAFYALAGAVCFFRYSETGRVGTLALSSAFLAIAVTTKDEGLFFPVAFFLVLVLFLFIEKKPRLHLLWFLVPLVTLAGPWLAFKAAYGLGFGHARTAEGLSEMELHWQVIPHLLDAMFFSSDFNLIFAFWAVLTVLGLRTVLSTRLGYLYLVVIQVMGVFALIYLVLEPDLAETRSALPRNMLTYVPIVYFISAVLASRLVTGKAPDAPSGGPVLTGPPPAETDAKTDTGTDTKSR